MKGRHIYVKLTQIKLRRVPFYEHIQNMSFPLNQNHLNFFNASLSKSLCLNVLSYILYKFVPNLMIIDDLPPNLQYFGTQATLSFVGSGLG